MYWQAPRHAVRAGGNKRLFDKWDTGNPQFERRVLYILRGREAWTPDSQLSVSNCLMSKYCLCYLTVSPVVIGTSTGFAAYSSTEISVFPLSSFLLYCAKKVFIFTLALWLYRKTRCET